MTVIKVASRVELCGVCNAGFVDWNLPADFLAGFHRGICINCQSSYICTTNLVGPEEIEKGYRVREERDL